MVGLTEDRFNRWALNDMEFGEAVRAARYGFLSSREGNIAQAGNRGQWQADAHILARDPETKSIWGEQTGGRGGVAIQVVLNVDRTPVDSYQITTVTAREA